jgi:hypothetical protein
MSPVQFSRYVNDMPSHSRHVELASYADKMAINPTSRQPALLVNFVTSYQRDLEQWLRKWSTAMLFAKACRLIPTPRPVCLFGEQSPLGRTRPFGGGGEFDLYTRLTWSIHIDHVTTKAKHRMGVLALSPKQD